MYFFYSSWTELRLKHKEEEVVTVALVLKVRIGVENREYFH
jgi:hypothetical protein